MKKLLLILLCFALAFSLAGCADKEDLRNAQRAAEDREAELIATGYRLGHDDGFTEGHDAGYEEGYADGYADGHKEAQGHSAKYDELIRQAYQTTGGSGSIFKINENGDVMVEETAPDGRKMWVYFVP